VQLKSDPTFRLVKATAEVDDFSSSCYIEW